MSGRPTLQVRRDAEIQRVRLRTNTTPPPGMPMPIRFELNTRSGA